MTKYLSPRYLAPIWSVGLAVVATLISSQLIPVSESPFFLVAIMYSAWRAGVWAGVVATVLSVIADVYLADPVFSFQLQRHEISRIVVDVIASVVVGSMSLAQRRFEKEREELLENEKNARLEAEQASNVKDEIVAVVSHELRTPLTTIKTLTHILRFKDPSAEEKEEYLADIAAECERQIDLVHNLLDLSRIQQGGLELDLRAINVEKVIRDSIKIERIEAVSHQHEIEINISRHLPPVSADESALRRSICTMVENSIKYTNEGGKITISAFETYDGLVAIEVKDNGRGIHPHDLPHIFDRFYRGHLLPAGGDYRFSDDQEIKGIGLGLHLAKILIEGMKGSIGVKSDVGSGSAFTIMLRKWNSEMN